MQALSEEDRRLWMEAMDGREPVGYKFILQWQREDRERETEREKGVRVLKEKQKPKYWTKNFRKEVKQWTIKTNFIKQREKDKNNNNKTEITSPKCHSKR